MSILQSRKQAIGALLIIVAIFCAFTVFFMPIQAHATTASNGAKVYKLSSNTTYKKYDITSDRKADRILIKTSGDHYSKHSIAVYVNGKKVFSKNTYFYDLEAQIVQLKNGKSYLYLYAPSDNGDAEICGLYQMSRGKLKLVVDCNKGFGSKPLSTIGNHFGGEVLKVSGNSMTIRFRAMARFSGQTYADYSYTYRNKKLQKNSRIGTLQVGYTKNKAYKAKKSIPVYKNTNCTSKKFTIKKGQSVKFTKVYVNGNAVRYQVKVGNKTGWVKVGKSNSLLYKGKYYYEPPFEGIYLAG